MDTTAVVTVCVLHLVFGGLVGALISNVFNSILLMRLQKELDKAIDDMFNKDLTLDDLAEEVDRLTSEVDQLKAKFPDVELPADEGGYVSDSSTEADSTD